MTSGKIIKPNGQPKELPRVKLPSESAVRREGTLLDKFDIPDSVHRMALNMHENLMKEWFPDRIIPGNELNLSQELLVVIVANGGYPFALDVIRELESVQDIARGNQHYRVGYMTIKVRTKDSKGDLLKNPTVETFPSEIEELLRRYESHPPKLLFTDDIYETGHTMNDFVKPVFKELFFKSRTNQEWEQYCKTAAFLWKPAHSHGEATAQSNGVLSEQRPKSDGRSLLDFYGWRVTDHWLRGYGMNTGSVTGRGLHRIVLDPIPGQDFTQPIAVRFDCRHAEAQSILNDIAMNAKPSGKPINLNESLLKTRP